MPWNSKKEQKQSYHSQLHKVCSSFDGIHGQDHVCYRRHSRDRRVECCPHAQIGKNVAVNCGYNTGNKQDKSN